ncbi:hypothetical protein [Hyphococcus luteus]|uniref:hypothetical protein n=1 Tax=Hyphococcus luteus TaxID=2058213 RepID=UPI0010574C1E|nr:hypothetical protein [Marinicaulis flavus]
MTFHLGYLLFDEAGAHVRCKCDDPLNAHQLKILEEAQSVVSSVYEVVETSDFFRLNLEDFASTASHVLEEAKAGGAKIVSDPNWLLRAKTRFGQRFSNILYSFSAMRDICSRIISSSFGDKSQQAKGFKKLLSDEFDNCFAHRLFYKLRNYSSHYSIPDLDIYLLRLPQRGGPAESAELKIEISKTVLTVSSFGWGKILIADLTSPPDEINIAEVIQELGMSMVRMLSYVLNSYEGRLVKSGYVLWSACFVAGVPENGRLVAWDGTRVTSQDHDGCRLMLVPQFNDCWRQLQSAKASV